MNRRISSSTWQNWCEGIAINLQLPAFNKAWTETKEKTKIFHELSMLE
jgi:hypothetical protein